MTTYHPKNLPKHFWTSDRGLTSMLILLCISNFIVTPFFSKGQLPFLIVRFIWLALLFAGISTLSKNKVQAMLFSVIPLLLLTVNIIQLFRNDRVLEYIGFTIDITVFLLLIGMVFIKVFENGPVNMHRVVGAVVVYMLVGNLWAVLYQFLFLHVPGSLQLAAADTGIQINPATYLYFSFTTLTTTGYGDFLPALPITRTLAIMEQLIGVLYPAILIGRLVSLVTTPTSSKNSRG